ncbi:MAG: hypothetical protein Q8J59_01710 [Methylotenera sp.]|nr:hypothetical protein [Methylotenera sp.]MDO9389439.1 hypothetical protein [Methylotenera sp.]MDP2102946.1 hypothetical protein [Methylotenera sp.]MDP2280386.1 hypothetical protein [Methylotenera sp.]MDP3059852.1 hypothetical protein [Methylotenera sp.]
MQKQVSASKAPSEQFDPELPTSRELMVAICCVATQYALKPSHELAVLASELAHKLRAPEYAETKLIEDIAERLVKQWEAIVSEYGAEDNWLLATHNTLQ